MIRKGDFDGIYELLNVLKANQRFNFDAQNDAGDTIIHEVMKRNNYEELKYLLDVIDLKSTKDLDLLTGSSLDSELEMD